MSAHETTELPGLSEDSPDGFMAAIGLLRVLAEDRGLDVRLSWDAVAVLHGIGEDDLLEGLVEHMRERYLALEWNWAKTTRKITPEQHAEVLRKHRDDDRFVRFLAGMVTPTVQKTERKKDGKIEETLANTRLDMTSGSQQLLAQLQALAKKMSPAGAKPKPKRKKSPSEPLALQYFREALFERRYHRGSPSFGWDPNTIQDHAYSPRNPSQMKPTSRPGVVWLVAEGLALHPVLPKRGRAVTTGTARLKRQTVYYWPAWDDPADIAWIRAVRRVPLWRLKQVSGVRRVWTSAFGSSGKYGMLRPAVPYEAETEDQGGGGPLAVVV